MSTDGRANQRWWELSKSEAYISIFDVVSGLYNDQTGRRDRNLRCARMYGNADMLGMGTYNRMTSPSLPEDRVKYNIISSMADAVTAKIGKMKPRVTILTDGATFQLGEEAKKLSKFIDGCFYKNKIHSLHQRGFQDGTVFDMGAVKHFIREGQIASERVLATELMVDDVDAMYGEPMSLYQVKFVHKDVLSALYPKKKSSIIQSCNSFERQNAAMNGMEDYVVVVEAWRLPTYEGADDGRHVISIEKDYLIDEPYARPYFPFTFFKWSNRLTGFWGQSLAERLIGTQLEINKLLRFIQKSFHLGSAFKVFLEHGSKVTKEHLNNEVGSIVYYTGQKPEFYAPKVVNDEVFRHLQFLIQSAYEEAGVSQLSATSKKPAGIDSGKALREYNDVETERFAITSQDYEQSFLETARQYMDLAREIHDDGGDFEVVAESRKFVESIKWSEIDIEHNQYIMKMFPTSSLPTTPAGRMAFVQELVNTGYIDKNYATRLLDFPDLESYESLLNAPLDDILNCIDDIISHGKYSAPEPFQDLRLGVKTFQSAYLKARRLKVPEDRLEMLIEWMTEAQATIDNAAKAAQQQEMAAGAAQMGHQATADANAQMAVDSNQAQLDGGQQAVDVANTPPEVPAIPQA